MEFVRVALLSTALLVINLTLIFIEQLLRHKPRQSSSQLGRIFMKSHKIFFKFYEYIKLGQFEFLEASNEYNNCGKTSSRLPRYSCSLKHKGILKGLIVVQ